MMHQLRWLAIFSFITFISPAWALWDGDFEYEVTASDTVTITDYSGSASTLAIPASIDGKPVTSIGFFAFDNCTSLQSITISASIISIRYAAFDNCTSLHNITIPSNVTMLEGAAFASCTSLTNIIISSGVNFIDEATFYGCVNLTSINIPSSVKGIAERVFRGCTSLKSITIPQGVDWIGTGTFSDCTSLRGVYFQGTPPDSFEAFELSYPTIYYLPDATGWGTTFQDRSTELWNPSIQTSHEDFGVVSNRFQFSVSGPTNALVKIESTTNLTEDVWQPAGTYPLNQGAVYYNDPAYTNHPNRYYRLVMPD